MLMTMPMSSLPGVGSPSRRAPVTSAERMYALDEARDGESFEVMFATIARGRDDNASFLQRIGLA
jgi:hypothetical protein